MDTSPSARTGFSRTLGCCEGGKISLGRISTPASFKSVSTVALVKPQAAATMPANLTSSVADDHLGSTGGCDPRLRGPDGADAPAGASFDSVWLSTHAVWPSASRRSRADVGVVGALQALAHGQVGRSAEGVVHPGVSNSAGRPASPYYRRLMAGWLGWCPVPPLATGMRCPVPEQRPSSTKTAKAACASRVRRTPGSG